MIAFHLPIVPPKATSQTKRLVMVAGKPRFFAKKEHQQAENDLLTLCQPYKPAEPLAGPLKLQVDFVFPWRASEPKRRLSLGRVPHEARPDCDNLVKLIADVLTKLRFYGDDGQVSDLHVTKAWGDRVGINVAVSKINFPAPEWGTRKHPPEAEGQQLTGRGSRSPGNTLSMKSP